MEQMMDSAGFDRKTPREQVEQSLQKLLQDSSAIVGIRETYDAFMRHLNGEGAWNCFRVSPRNAADEAVYRWLACRFGDNAKFLDIPNFCGWPMNPSITTQKPFIAYEGNFYLFLGPALIRKPLRLLEGIIK